MNVSKISKHNQSKRSQHTHQTSSSFVLEMQICIIFVPPEPSLLDITYLQHLVRWNGLGVLFFFYTVTMVVTIVLKKRISYSPLDSLFSMSSRIDPAEGDAEQGSLGRHFQKINLHGVLLMH